MPNSSRDGGFRPSMRQSRAERRGRRKGAWPSWWAGSGISSKSAGRCSSRWVGPPLVGPAGSGQLAKLCNQVIVAVTIGAVSEALLLAERGGADPAAVREALQGGFADSRILTEHGARILERDFAAGGSVRNQLKDLDNALASARESRSDLPVTALVRDLFGALAEREGGAELDHSALFLELQERAQRK